MKGGSIASCLPSTVRMIHTHRGTLLCGRGGKANVTDTGNNLFLARTPGRSGSARCYHESFQYTWYLRESSWHVWRHEVQFMAEFSFTKTNLQMSLCNYVEQGNSMLPALRRCFSDLNLPVLFEFRLIAE